jgi:hypothetical protein
MRIHARATLVGTLAATALVPAAAGGQTAGPSIAQTQQTAPNRYLNFGQANQQNLGTATRAAGLNPTGVNYSDCVSDMTLGFPVLLNGFGTGNTDGMQIWASVSGQCTVDTDRGSPGPPSCWLVNSGLEQGQVLSESREYYVRVQDLVGPQQAPSDPPILVHEDASACSAQPSYAGVTITLWFVPIDAPGHFDSNATALEWPVSTDLVGPPAPVGLNAGAGQNLLTLTWTANNDSDTLGYDVFIDPPPNSPTSPGTQVICPDSGGADGSSPSASDAACYSVNVGQSGSALGVCSSTALGAALVQDSGASPLTADEDAGDTGNEGETDAADDGGDAATPVEGTAGGIATIPCQYALVGQCPSGQPVYTAQATTITGETNTAYTIPGLIDGVTYAVAVSAVDNSGNPGPPSAQTPDTCNYPAPINDFYAVYRDAGGMGGGGFCALQGGTKLDASSGSPVSSSIALGALGAAAIAAGRRRRRRR